MTISTLVWKSSQHATFGRSEACDMEIKLLSNTGWKMRSFEGCFFFLITTRSFCTSAAWDGDKKASISIWQVRTIDTSFQTDWYHWHRKLQLRPIVPDRTAPERLFSEQTRHLLACLILTSCGWAYFWVYHTG